MPQIVVDDHRTKGISEATGSVEILDQHDKHLGYVAHGFTDEDIAIAKQRLAWSEPRYTTAAVPGYLRSLETLD